MTADSAYVLGLDMGTSGINAALFTAAGEQVGLQVEEYLQMPGSQLVEVDPDLYWQPIVRTIKNLITGFRGRPEQILAVSTCTFGETVFAMAADGSPVRPAIHSWMDNRSIAEAQLLIDRVGPPVIQTISGQGDIGPTWPATMFLWMARHEPEAFGRTAKFLLPDDYLLFRLSGEMVAEETMWASSLVMDIRRRAWSETLMAAAEITSAKLPQLVPPGTVIGNVGRACAEATGLSRSTKVVAGAMDMMSAAVGVGNIAPGMLSEAPGTVVALLATTQGPVIDGPTRVPRHLHAVPGMYCLVAWTPTGGLLLKWFKDRFREEENRRAIRDGIDVYELLCQQASHVEPGSDGLTMLPYLGGVGFPGFAPSASGVLLGLTLRHGKPHMVRAILESVAYHLRRELETLRGLGVEAGALRVSGGGARSTLWNQVKADVLGLPIAVPADKEAAVLGAAIVAAVGAGLHPDFRAAVHAMTRPGAMVYPDAATGEVYTRGYQRYRKLLEHFRDLL